MKEDNSDLEELLKSIKELRQVVKSKKKLSSKEAFALGKLTSSLKDKIDSEVAKK